MHQRHKSRPEVPCPSRLVALVLAVALVAFGCGGDGADDPVLAAPTAAAESSEPTTTVDESQEPTVVASDDAEGSDAAAPADPEGVALLNAGSEPRIELGISSAGTRSIAMASTHISTGAVGADRIDERESAEFVVAVAVSPNAGGAQVTIVPTIVSLDVTTPPPVDRQLGPLEWTLNRNGLIVDAAGPDLSGTPVAAAAALFATPELFAVVPSEPVGIGAQWQYALSPTTPNTIFTVDLISISDTSIELSVAFAQSDEDSTVTSTTVGTYDRASLLAVDVDTQLRTDFTSQTTRSGEIIDIEGTFEIARTYVMESDA